MKTWTLKKAKKAAWDNFSKFIRLRDALKTTGTTHTLLCFTCRKPYPAFGKGCAQAGHFIPGRGNSQLIDEVGVRGQCYNCNVNLKGAWVEFEAHLVQEIGQEAVEGLKRGKYSVLKRELGDWLELAELYKQKYEELLFNATTATPLQSL